MSERTMAEIPYLANGRALHGNWIYGLKIAKENGARKLARRWRAMEFGEHERIATHEHSDYPGISVIDLFRAPTSERANEPIELDEARLHNNAPVRLLLSVVTMDVIAVTSRLGYDGSGEYIVDQQAYAPQLPEVVDLFDVSAVDSFAHLTQSHVQRVRELGGNPATPMSQRQADYFFGLIVRNTVETP